MAIISVFEDQNARRRSITVDSTPVDHPDAAGDSGHRGPKFASSPVVPPAAERVFEGLHPSLAQNEHWVACKKLLVAVRAAGGTWIAYRKVQRKSVLRMRSMVVRGRARTSDADPLIAPIFRLPNELCWHVLQFWRAKCDATGEVI